MQGLDHTGEEGDTIGAFPLGSAELSRETKRIGGFSQKRGSMQASQKGRRKPIIR